MPNDPEQVFPVVEDIIRRIDSRCPVEARQAMHLSLVEMTMNAIEHGNLAIGSDTKGLTLQDGSFEDLVESRRRQEPYASRCVLIEYHLEPHRVLFTIRDEGVGFDWRAQQALSMQGPASPLHGRGILIARTKMDACIFEPKGNAVTLVKYYQTL